MGTGFRGAFVISWTQVELDGAAAAPLTTLRLGATWQWQGRAVRVDGPDDVLVLADAEQTIQLRRHAARAIHRLVGPVKATPRAHRVPDPEDPILDHGFSLTDGRRRYTATLIERADLPPLCMFLNELPPTDVELWVSHVASGVALPHRTGGEAPSVICFTPDTRIATPDGARRVADLDEDDLVLTRDDGPQPVRWIGHRRLSGARLYTMPDLRPIRIRAGAMGTARPSDDLVVSPQHRMLVRGPMAQRLFNTDEVLVAARDMVNDRGIQVDRRHREVTYVHLLLDRHSIVMANGVETESFHPATMDLTTVDSRQLAELADRVPGVARDPSVYGAFARRMLTASEASVLSYAARRGH